MDWEGALKREMRSLIFRLQAPPECSIPEWGLRPAAWAYQTMGVDVSAQSAQSVPKRLSGTDATDQKAVGSDDGIVWYDREGRLGARSEESRLLFPISFPMLTLKVRVETRCAGIPNNAADLSVQSFQSVPKI